MLSRKRCPHTGVVNFFFDAEPHMAVGSVLKIRAEGSSEYQWLFYSDPCAETGTAPDLKTAEYRVTERCRKAAKHPELIGHAA